MVTLSFFRHAKSAWDNPGLRDFDRPLAPRGMKAARRMGSYIFEHDLVPDLVLCSTAQRARQTLELASSEWAEKPEVRYEDGLYHAGPREMLGLVSQLPDGTGHTMLVGHNPGFHALATMMAEDGKPEDLQKLSAKFPTAALAVIDFDGAWSEISAGTGHLRLFVLPRELN